MFSSTRKKDKYKYDIIWSILMAIIAYWMVYSNTNIIFWTYSMIVYAIPIILNILFFIGIYDCFKDKNDFDVSYKKHFDVTEQVFLEKYYKQFKISVTIIKMLVVLLIISIVVLLALTFTIPDLVKNDSFRLYAYGLYYFIFLFGSLTEKKMTQSFNNRVDKNYFRNGELNNG